MSYEDNDLCEICQVHESLFPPDPLGWYYWINQHCIDLRRNRMARNNKNVKVKETVF